jgi:hypothetical protein
VLTARAIDPATHKFPRMHCVRQFSLNARQTAAPGPLGVVAAPAPAAWTLQRGSIGLRTLARWLAERARAPQTLPQAAARPLWPTQLAAAPTECMHSHRQAGWAAASAVAAATLRAEAAPEVAQAVGRVRPWVRLGTCCWGETAVGGAALGASWEVVHLLQLVVQRSCVADPRKVPLQLVLVQQGPDAQVHLREWARSVRASSCTSPDVR